MGQLRELTQREKRDVMALARSIVKSVEHDQTFPLAIGDEFASQTVIRMAQTLLDQHDELEKRELRGGG